MDHPARGRNRADYLTDGVVREDVHIGTNVSESVRYHLLANGAYQPQFKVDVPNVHAQTEFPGMASLTTTIQPHYQIPRANELPTYFNYGLRFAGPVLALAVNSPFLPPDMYDEGTTEAAAIEEGWAEHRICVFETAMNPRYGDPKVRFPRDIETTQSVINRIADDAPLVPMAIETKGRFDDRFTHFNHKHGTYWRWVRPVFDGASESAANARIEFRPLPNQPTIRDGIGFTALFAGLERRLAHADHPVVDLSWQTAKKNFYNAMREGLDADLTWIRADGNETRARDEIYPELFDLAVAGLETRGNPKERAESFIAPIRARYESRLTPAPWKRQRAREAAENGAELEETIYRAQREYLARQSESLIDGTFVEWESRSARAM